MRQSLDTPEPAGIRTTRRILFVTSDLGGGTGDHLLQMIGYWDKARWEAEIISEAPLTSRRAPEVQVEYLSRSRWLGRFPISQLRALYRINRHLKNRDPEIVHCYFYWSILYGRFLKKLGRVRHLVENREDEGFAWGEREYARLRRSRSLPDRVICVSEAVRRVAVDREGVDPARTLVIHNGVRLPRQSRPERESCRLDLGIKHDEVLVGMVSNLHRPIKGVSYFLDAIPLILEAEPSARFAIFGHGFGRGAEERLLREKAKSLGIDRPPLFAGFRPDIDRCYAATDVFVMTSLSEGLSIALLESMSHGLPVVVTAVGGNPEVVVEGETGFLVPPRQPAAFADRVIRLLRDRELRARMGEAGRRRVEEKFLIRQAARRYLEVYEDVLSSAAV